MTQLNPLKSNQFWLLGIATGLITLHFTLVSRSNNNNLFSASLLFGGVVLGLLWMKRDKITWHSSPLSSSLAGLLIAGILFKSTNVVDDDVFLPLFPLMSGLALALLASGFKGLKQYNQEWLLLGFIAVPWRQLVYPVLNLSLLTAKFASGFLWLLGFEVKREGVIVSLPTGSIEVYNGCAGLKLMVQLLGIALIFLVLVPTGLKQKVLLPIFAVFIGFVINGMRVALMAVLVALSEQEAFAYWHLGQGSLLFSLIAVLIFALVCHKVAGGKYPYFL
jgi:cyanoexosortase A